MSKIDKEQERWLKDNDESVGTVAARLQEEGFESIAQYDNGDETVKRFARPEDGKQVLVFIRYADRKRSMNVERWELFTEVSNSPVTVEYLAAFEDAIA